MSKRISETITNGSEQDRLVALRMGRDLHKRARIRAVEEDRTLSGLIREAVEIYLAKTQEQATA